MLRGFFMGKKKTPGKEDLSVFQHVLDAIPRGAVRPSQGIAGFQLLLPVMQNSLKSPARIILAGRRAGAEPSLGWMEGSLGMSE